MISPLDNSNSRWITFLLSKVLHTCSFLWISQRNIAQFTMILFLQLFCIQGLFRTQSVGATQQHGSTKKGRAGASVPY